MRKNFFIGAIFITFGVLFLLDNLGIADVGDIIHDYWPLILIFWGMSLLFRKHEPPMNAGPSESAQPISPHSNDQETLHESSIFGNLFIVSSSQQFKGGSTSTIFGDCDLDLSKTSFADGEHELRCSTIFGNSIIILPEHAAVSISISSIFGTVIALQQQREGFATSLNIATPEYDTQPRRLKIIISKIFGNSNISARP